MEPVKIEANKIRSDIHADGARLKVSKLRLLVVLSSNFLLNGHVSNMGHWSRSAKKNRTCIDTGHMDSGLWSRAYMRFKALGNLLLGTSSVWRRPTFWYQIFFAGLETSLQHNRSVHLKRLRKEP